MRLTVIIASRERPALLKHTLAITLSNVVEPDTRILVALDDDDEPVSLPDDPRVIVSVKPREDTRGPKYDRALIEAPADVYLPLADYTPIHRKGFDTAILDAARVFPDGVGCVCTPLINASFPGLQAPTAKLVELMGYIYPPDYPFWFIDHHLDDIARLIGRYIVVDVESDHATFAGHRRTLGMTDVAFWADYFDAMAPKRRALAYRIIDGLDEPEWRKRQLKANAPLVEYRSVWVNDRVREQHYAQAPTPTDARYERVKALALKALAS